MRITLLSVLAATVANAQKGSDADGLLQLFMGPVKYGPAPTGCSKYEVIVGKQ
jgi:hypothetical protein